MTIVVVFDTVNMVLLKFSGLSTLSHVHGGKLHNGNGTTNLYLPFGYNYSLQRYISTSFMTFLEIDSYNQ
jgi:hypothetical protein